MGTLHRFPGSALPAEMTGVSAALAKAMELLAVVREHLPRHPEHPDDEHELEVLGRAILALQAARPLHLTGEATPETARAAHASALVSEALVLADLCGQALFQLEAPRQGPTIAVVLNALTDAMTCGPETARPPFPPSPTPHGPASA